MKSFVQIVLIILLTSCKQESPESIVPIEMDEIESVDSGETILSIKNDRSESYKELTTKVNNGDSIFIHILVPLCDNDNQGIVPVPALLGNGEDPKNNLYWGARYGLKSHFARQSSWQLIESKSNISDKILERVVFKKLLSSGSIVFITADAYRGDSMKHCLDDYFDSIAGKKNEEFIIKGANIGIGSNADLTVFNGHNGLMDIKVNLTSSNDDTQRETAIIGCASYFYFEEYIIAAGVFPVLTTSNLMAPEAYVVEALIDSWLLLKTDEEIIEMVSISYDKYQKCGIEAASNLFYSGWQ